MKKTIYISIFVLFFTSLYSLGQENSGIDKNLENLSGQYAECAAYYTIVYHAMISSNENESAKAYDQLQETATFYSLLLASQGRTKELAAQVTNSRIEMYIKKMKQEADNRNENISVLINKYHFVCQELMANPPNDLQKLIEAMSEKKDK